MASIVFDPDNIASNSSAVAVGVTEDSSQSSDIALNENSASDNAVAGSSNSSAVAVGVAEDSSQSSDIVVVDAIADAASDNATGASNAASGAAIGASSNSSDVAAIEGDDRYAKSIYSDPATGSFAVFKLDITSDSHIYISHSDTAVA